MKRAKFRVRSAAMILIAAAGILGCGGPAGPEVVVYVAIDRGESEPILQRFESETGIRVKPLYDAEAVKTTGLVTRLLAEAENPRCDVFWNNEPVQTFLLADRGVLDRYEPDAAADIPPEYRDPDGRWTGIATRARVIVYNTEHVAEADIPHSLWDLTDPKWRGKVAVSNAQFGTMRTHVAALFAVLGPEKAQELLEGLVANEVRIVDGNAMVKNLVARASPGASPIYVGLTDTDDVLSGQADGEPVDMVYPDQDSLGTLVIPSTVCLVQGAPHPETARRLIDYLVGPDVERALATGRSGFIPVREGAPAGRAVQRLGQPKAMELSAAALLEQLEPSSQWTREHFHP